MGQEAVAEKERQMANGRPGNVWSSRVSEYFVQLGTLAGTVGKGECPSAPTGRSRAEMTLRCRMMLLAGSIGFVQAESLPGGRVVGDSGRPIPGATETLVWTT